MTRKVYRTYVNGTVVYEGSSLREAIGAWDNATFKLECSTPGGISVNEFRDGLMVRDGWVLHIHNDGTVYLSTRLGEV